MVAALRFKYYNVLDVASKAPYTNVACVDLRRVTLYKEKILGNEYDMANSSSNRLQFSEGFTYCPPIGQNICMYALMTFQNSVCRTWGRVSAYGCMSKQAYGVDVSWDSQDWTARHGSNVHSVVSMSVQSKVKCEISIP